MEEALERDFVLRTLKREKGILQSCCASLSTTLSELIYWLNDSKENESSQDPVKLQYEKEFVLRTCEREKSIYQMIGSNILKSIDELVQLLDKTTTVHPETDNELPVDSK